MLILRYWPDRASRISSVGKESACNAEDSSLIPGSGRSLAEGIGYPLQYTWSSLVAQLVKNPPAIWETWVQSLGWEDPLEKGKATHSSLLAWRIPWTTVHGVSKSCARLSDFHFHFLMGSQFNLTHTSRNLLEHSVRMETGGNHHRAFPFPLHHGTSISQKADEFCPLQASLWLQPRETY